MGKITHGLTVGLKLPPLYPTWSQMKSRCYDPKATGYPNYGGRGIKVCSRWRKSFVAFAEDVSPRPKGVTLDRINNDGNYEPGNVRWATRREQNLNSRLRGERVNTAKLTVDDVREIRRRYESRTRFQRGDGTQIRLAKDFGVTQTTIGRIVLRKSWSHVP